MTDSVLETTDVRKWKAYEVSQPLPLDWPISIPGHWKIQRLKEVADARPSNVDKKSVEGDRPVRLCNYVDVYKNDRITDEIEFMPATATEFQISQFSIRAGDVIITKDSEAWDDIAVPAYVPNTLEDLVCGYHLTLIRPHSDRLDGAFLSRCIQAEGLADQFRVAANGITRFGLGTQDIRCAIIPVPPLREQRAIAAFLDRETAQVDALVAKKQRLIDLLEEKRQAVISYFVTKGLDANVKMKQSDVQWIGKIPEHWEVWRLKHACKLETGHTPRKSEEDYWISEECVIPWVSLNDTKTLDSNDFIGETVSCISMHGMNNSSAHLIEAGAVVVNRDGARVGLAAITERPMCVSQHIIAWVCGPKVFNQYLLHALYAMESEIYRITAGSTIPTIGMPEVKSMTMPLPPMKEQIEIVETLLAERQRIARLTERLKESIDTLTEYRSALITAAVTGQIDVRQEVTIDN